MRDFCSCFCFVYFCLFSNCSDKTKPRSYPQSEDRKGENKDVIEKYHLALHDWVEEVARNPIQPCPSFAPMPHNIKRKRGRPRSEATPEFNTHQMRHTLKPLEAMLQLYVGKHLSSLTPTQRQAEVKELQTLFSAAKDPMIGNTDMEEEPEENSKPVIATRRKVIKARKRARI